MNAILMRYLASVLAIGLAMWTPGLPQAFALEITPEIRAACEQFEPALRDIALNEVVPKLEESSKPEASPEAKAEAQAVSKEVVKVRFEVAFREMGTTTGGPTPAMMKDMAEKMLVAGIDPRTMGGEFRGPSPEALAAMTPEQQKGYETWKEAMTTGDFSKMHEMQVRDSYKAGIEAGMTPEAMARSMETMQQMERTTWAGMESIEAAMRDAANPYRANEANEATTPQEPRSETSGASITTFEKYPDGHATCPADKTHAPGVAEGPGHCI